MSYDQADYYADLNLTGENDPEEDIDIEEILEEDDELLS